MPLPVKFQHESPANTIFENGVGLSPIPLTANSLGQRPTAFIGIVGDDLTEKVDVVCVYGTFTVSEYLCHVENIAEIALERYLFFRKKMVGRIYPGERLRDINWTTTNVVINGFAMKRRTTKCIYKNF